MNRYRHSQRYGDKPMTTAINAIVRRGAASLLALAVLVMAGCDGGILDVDDRGIVTPEDIDAAGPAAVPTLINGLVGNYHEATDDIIRYSAMLTDEMVLAGTFPTRAQVDSRRMSPNNATLTNEVYVPLHQARMQADTTAFIFDNLLGNPDFEGVQANLREGITLARLYGGFSRLWLGELYCWSILTGMANESSPLMPNDRIQDALTFLTEAEQLATQEGLNDVRLAAVLGQARAHLWLGNYTQARDLAQQVPRDFTYFAEYSNNDPAQFNEMYTFTHGDTEAIRWSVGDGSQASRGNEVFEHFEKFVRLNLIDVRPPGFTSFDQSIPVNLQRLYSRPEADVFMASGYEARLIEAEVAVRNGQTGAAEDIINDLRSDFSTRATIQFGVNPPEPENLLQPITLTGELEADVKRVADERARELWLTGDRHVTSRRLRLDPTVNIDLFPPVKGGIGGGDDIAFPIVQRELDNNPNLSSGDACPTGSPGSWS